MLFAEYRGSRYRHLACYLAVMLGSLSSWQADVRAEDSIDSSAVSSNSLDGSPVFLRYLQECNAALRCFHRRFRHLDVLGCTGSADAVFKCQVATTAALSKAGDSLVDAKTKFLSQHNLGLAYELSNKPQQALQEYQRARSFLDQVRDANPLSGIILSYQIMSCHLDLKDYDQVGVDLLAILLQLAQMKDYESVFYVKDLEEELSLVHNELINYYNSRNRYLDAVYLTKAWLELVERTYGPMDRRIEPLLRELLMAYQKLGDRPSAIGVLQRIGTLDREAEVPVREAQAALYLEDAHFVEAEQLLKQVHDERRLTLRQLKERSRSKNAAVRPQPQAIFTADLAVTLSLHQLGRLAQRQRDLGAAQKYFDESLATRKRILPRSDERIAEALIDKARVHLARQEYAAAASLLEEALKLLDELPPTNMQVPRLRVDALHDLARLHLVRRQLDRAGSVLEKVLQLLRDLPDAGDATAVASVLTDLGTQQWLKGGMLAAQELFRKA